MSTLGILRSTYFYAALTIAGGAIVIAATGLIALALQLTGLAERPPAPDRVREQVSTAIAIFIFAVPIGLIHLWLVRRALTDPDERASGPRHLFLNGWIVVGLLMSMTSIVNLAQILIVLNSPDVAFPIASFAAGMTVTAAGWLWRDRYLPARRDAQMLGAFATMGLATVFIVTLTLPLLGAVLHAIADSPWRHFVMGVNIADRDPAPVIWASLVGVAAAFVVWAIGLRWQWPWRDVGLRTGYAAAGYGIGAVLVAVPGSDAVARFIGIARGGVRPAELAGVWETLVIGAVLMAMHLPWLLRDRGRVSLPAHVTDRLVSGLTALAGLGALTLAAVASGSVVVQDMLRIGPPQPDPLRVRDGALATLLLGTAFYPLAWRGFLRSTAADPRSGLRRACLLFVACVSLLGALIGGVTSVANLIRQMLGASLSESAVRVTIDAAGWAVVFAVVLAAHLWLLLRDMRAARALAPAAPARPVEADPLLAVLEDVAERRISTREGAARVRALGAR